MIQPGTYDIVIQKGADFEKEFQLFDSDGDPVNLTGSTVESEIWTERKHNKLADFTVTVINQALGRFKLYLADSITEDLPSSSYYDIRITDANGFSNYWVRGEATAEIGYTE